jgi:hypothetical protein
MTIALFSDIHEADRQVVWFWRIPYDIKAAQERFSQAGLVSRSALRLEHGR